MKWVEEIEELAGGEPIELVRLGKDLTFDPDADLQAFHETAGAALSWEEARPILDRGETVDDYWKWPLLAWTHSWVIFTHDYDTMRDFRRLPRNPDGEWDGEVIE